MSPEDAAMIAADAQIDQARAKASENLTDHISTWQQIVHCDGGSDTNAYTESVAATVKFVDPDDELPDEQSNRLVYLAEVLAVAISRLAEVRP